MDRDALKEQRGRDKLARIPIKIQPYAAKKKPDWIRIRLPSGDRANRVQQLLRQQRLHTVCEEASCPNLPECFSHGTATFMILGNLCTRRCSFCDVAHGKPLPVDTDEPKRLAEAVVTMQLNYVVITSVDRDDLQDGGAGHFSECVLALRQHVPTIQIEILVPDFRGRLEKSLAALARATPDVFNHNIETVPRLYRAARPGSDYQHSLQLLAAFKKNHPDLPTKSGLMLGLGESMEEVQQTLTDLRNHQVDMVTIGQYLSPSSFHLPVDRYVPPEEFKQLEQFALQIGFRHVASGPLVRSSYHADVHAKSFYQQSI